MSDMEYNYDDMIGEILIGIEEDRANGVTYPYMNELVDQEKFTKEQIEALKLINNFKQTIEESNNDKSFVFHDIGKINLNNVKFVDTDGNEKIINVELNNVKDLVLDTDTLTNLSNN